jgi:hypothetical protein
VLEHGGKARAGIKRISAAHRLAQPAVELGEAPLRGPNEINAAMAQWGREQNFGVIVVPDPATNAHRKLINELAVRYRLPVIHALRAGVRSLHKCQVPLSTRPQRGLPS